MGLETKMKKTFFYIFLICVLLPIQQIFGNWTGPVVVASGSWGSSTGQFGIDHQDSGDFLPREFGVDKNGIIVIADKVNNRLQLFKPDGSLYRIIHRPVEIKDDVWPWTLIVLPDGNSFLAELAIFDYAGTLLNKIDIKRTERYAGSNGYIIYNMDTKIYSLYSPTGQFIKTSTERPLELGKVKEQRISSGKYKITVTYADKEWGIVGAGVLPKYMRDTNGNLYGFGDVQVFRYDNCGREMASLTMPEKQTQEISRGPAVEPKIKVLAEYGSPVVAPNGDVYTWKRTPDTYSILKWTWMDDPSVPPGPDAPTGLAVAASVGGLYLSWIASPQDPGCVTGYEISRATSAGGVSSTIATVNAGALKYNDTTASAGTMYYYKVRAVAGNEFSPYSNEASGKR